MSRAPPRSGTGQRATSDVPGSRSRTAASVVRSHTIPEARCAPNDLVGSNAGRGAFVSAGNFIEEYTRKVREAFSVLSTRGGELTEDEWAALKFGSLVFVPIPDAVPFYAAIELYDSRTHGALLQRLLVRELAGDLKTVGRLIMPPSFLVDWLENAGIQLLPLASGGVRAASGVGRDPLTVMFGIRLLAAIALSKWQWGGYGAVSFVDLYDAQNRTPTAVFSALEKMGEFDDVAAQVRTELGRRSHVLGLLPTERDMDIRTLQYYVVGVSADRDFSEAVLHEVAAETRLRLYAGLLSGGADPDVASASARAPAPGRTSALSGLPSYVRPSAVAVPPPSSLGVQSRPVSPAQANRPREVAAASEADARRAVRLASARDMFSELERRLASVRERMEELATQAGANAELMAALPGLLERAKALPLDAAYEQAVINLGLGGALGAQFTRATDGGANWDLYETHLRGVSTAAESEISRFQSEAQALVRQMEEQDSAIRTLAGP